MLCVKYIKKHNDYKTIVITADWHPEEPLLFLKKMEESG